MATLLSLAAFAAVTVVTAAFTAPPRPAELPTVDTVRREDPDEEWARETTSADLLAAFPRYHPRWAWWLVRAPLIREVLVSNLVLVMRAR